MSSAKFVLKEPTSKEPTLVYLMFSYDTNRLKYSTGQKITPKYWNPTSQLARETVYFDQHAEFNNYLRKAANSAANVYRQLVNDGIKPTNDQLKSGIDKALLKPDTNTKSDFILFISGIISISSKRPNTLKHYKQTLKLLTDFKAASNRKLTFEEIDLTFYEAFMNYCLGRNYGLNTIGGFIKHIKVFMNEAFDRKLTANIEFKNKRFKTLQEDTDHIYLSNSEIELLYNYDLSNNPRLDKVRDMFIISCYTGLRYSDLIKINNNHLIDNRTKIKIKTEKTGEMVIIPLHKLIREILLKYDGIPDYHITNQKMNEYLKELGQLVGLEKQIQISSTKGGKKENNNFKKYELITVHTARRSFATNAFVMSVPTISIMKITGHRTEKAFLKYIKITQQENADKLSSHPFFV